MPLPPKSGPPSNATWHEVHARVLAEEAEAVAEVFARYGHGGVAIEEDPPTVAETPRMVTVKTYLPARAGSRRKIAHIERALRLLSMIQPIAKPEVRDIQEEDWAHAWKAFYSVQHIGDRIVIQPSWQDYTPATDEIIVRLDPGMAFGTGQHPSTRLCLQALEQHLKSGALVLDVGTGSGILAIAAAKLGAAHIDATDISPEAVRVAQENIVANDVQGVVSVSEGSVSDGGVYDLVVANLTARILEGLAADVVAATREGGIIIGGGIIAEQLPDVTDSLTQAGARQMETLSEGDWRAIIAVKG